MKYMTDFIRDYAEKHKITIKNATLICESVFQLLGETLYGKEEDLSLHGIGIFKHQTLAEKRVRHPGTGEMLTMPARTIIKFKETNGIKTQ